MAASTATTQMASSHTCHICLLPIPDEMVDRNHPLFGTKDHVQPKSLGGSNHIVNLQPAHFFCNQKRGAKQITAAMRLECSEEIRKHISKRFKKARGKSGVLHAQLLQAWAEIEALKRTCEALKRDVRYKKPDYCVGEMR